MKPKFLFALLVINGLVSIGSDSVIAATLKIDRDAIDLGETISKLIDLHPDAHYLVELAVNRASIANKCVVDLDAKDVNSSDKDIYQRGRLPKEKSNPDLAQPQPQNSQTEKKSSPDAAIAPEVVPRARRLMGARG